jgi:CheY-like chemotaxis protein
MSSRPLHIVVAEDDQEDLLFFEQALNQTGIPVNLSVASNGLELIKMLETERMVPQMIFLDINMPKMDGLTTLARLRALETFRTIPIVMLSTTESPQIVKEAYRRGATLFLRKPNQYSDYLPILESLLLKNYDHKPC